MVSLLLIGITYYSYWFSIRRYPVLQLRDAFPFQVFSYIGTKKTPLFSNYFLIRTLDKTCFHLAFRFMGMHIC